MSKKSLMFLLILNFFVFIIMVFPSFSQESWTTYDSVNTGGELPVNVVYSLATDHDGNKWFGTRENYFENIMAAIVKFDGQNWTNQNLQFTKNILEGDRDRDNRIWTIYVDSQNNVWAGTHGDGLFKFDGSAWSTYTMADGLGGNWIRDIIEDADGNLWFACGPEVNTTPVGEGGLTKFDGTNFTTFLSDFSAGTFVGGGNSDLGDNYCYALTIDLSGNLWIGTKGSGVSRINSDSTFTNFIAYNSGLPDDIINAGAADTDLDGNVYVGFGSSGDMGAAIFYGTNWAHISVLTGYRIRDIGHDSQGNIFFADKGADKDHSFGLLMLKDQNFVKYWHPDNSDLAGSLVNMIEIDEGRGDIWIVSNKGINVLSGVVQPTAVNQKDPEIVEEFRLEQNYPNPFNPATFIKYSVDKPQNVKLTIFSLKGQLVKTIVNAYKQPGSFTVSWDGTDNFGRPVSNGLYIYRIKTGLGQRAIKKAIILR